jgi:hypothetical protein
MPAMNKIANFLLNITVAAARVKAELTTSGSKCVSFSTALERGAFSPKKKNK